MHMFYNFMLVMLWDFNAMLRIFYAVLWEIEIKNLVIWYCMLCYEILTKTPSLTEEIHTFRSKMIRKHYLPLTCCKHLFFQKNIFKIQLKSCRILCYGMILREILSDRMLLYSNAMLWDSNTMLWDVNAMLRCMKMCLKWLFQECVTQILM